MICTHNGKWRLTDIFNAPTKYYFPLKKIVGAKSNIRMEDVKAQGGPVYVGFFQHIPIDHTAAAMIIHYTGYL